MATGRTVPNRVRAHFREPTPGHNLTPELRRLGGAFPGIEQDESVVILFNDEETGKVTVQDTLRTRQEVFMLGGILDYLVEVTKIPETELPLKKTLATPLFKQPDIIPLIHSK
jgi:hypothetical protein